MPWPVGPLRKLDQVSVGMRLRRQPSTSFQGMPDIAERQERVAPKLDCHGLFGRDQHGAARRCWTQRCIACCGAGTPLGDGRSAQPRALGQGVAHPLQRLRLGTNAQRRPGVAVKTTRHAASTAAAPKQHHNTLKPNTQGKHEHVPSRVGIIGRAAAC